jgi:hypothetical protein
MESKGSGSDPEGFAVGISPEAVFSAMRGGKTARSSTARWETSTTATASVVTGAHLRDEDISPGTADDE